MSSGMSRLFVFMGLFACMFSASFVGSAAASEPSLAPSGPWRLDYSDDSCALARTFGEADQSVTMILRRFEPNNGFRMILVGRRFRRARLGREAAFRFGPIEEEQELGYFPGDVSGIPALILFGEMRIAPLTEEQRVELEALTEENEDHAFEYPQIDSQRYQAVEYLSVDASGSGDFQLELESFGDAYDAFDTCMDELLTHWRIDVDAHRSLTRPAVPVESPGRWLTPSDYPTDMLRESQQGLVDFRLDVDAEGNVTDCHIQQSTRPVGFDDAVCNGLKNRARFEPALDADGNPIASYFVSSVRFQM